MIAHFTHQQRKTTHVKLDAEGGWFRILHLGTARFDTACHEQSRHIDYNGVQRGESCAILRSIFSLSEPAFTRTIKTRTRVSTLLCSPWRETHRMILSLRCVLAKWCVYCCPCAGVNFLNVQRGVLRCDREGSVPSVYCSTPPMKRDDHRRKSVPLYA